MAAMASTNMADISNTSRRDLSLMYDHSSQAVNSTHTGVGKYRDLLHEVHDPKAECQDVVTQYKIKVAVLKNELGHARQEKESSMTSLRLFMEALTRNTPSTIPLPLPAASASIQQASSPNTDHLSPNGKKQYEAEIERLRRENRSLKQKLNELERGEVFKGKSRECLDNGEGKEYLVNAIPSNIKSRGLTNVPIGPKHLAAAPTSHSTGSMLVGSWGHEEAQGDDIPTEPNSPVLAKSNLPSFDIGLNSLEENLKEDGAPEFDFAEALANNEGFPQPLVAPLVPPKEYPELEKGIDEQLAEEEVALRSFSGPAPTVLKTGFQVDGNKRGDEYDPATQPLRHYTRSQCLWRDPSSPSSSQNSMRVVGNRCFDEDLWSSIEEREEAIAINKRIARERGGREREFPDVFRHGIQYRPTERGINIARTVHLSNLPEDTTLRDALARIRGGLILSATLLSTTNLTGGLTVRVVFMNEVDAVNYTSYVAEHPIKFGEDNQEANVTLINTPTYPLNQNKRSGIQTREQTRCLCVPEFPEDISLRQLEIVLACGSAYRAESLVEMWIDEAGTLHLEFSSIDIAFSVFNLIDSRRMYGRYKPRFDRDPCTGPVVELEQDIPPRPPMFPRSRQTESGAQIKDTTIEDAGPSLALQVKGLQRKKLAALSNQKVEIPSFSDARLKSRAWADIMDDEDEDDDSRREEVHAAATLSYEEDIKSDVAEASLEDRVEVLRMENVNKLMAEDNDKSWEVKKRPIGFAGSKYASLVPDFQDHGERPRGRGSIKRTINRSSSDLGLSFKGPDRSSSSVGLGLRITEEAARKQEAESEFFFNTYTRHSSFENLAVRSPDADSHEGFKSSHDYGSGDRQLSRSPPRIDVRELFGSSSSLSKSSEREDTPSPTLPNPLQLFDTSLLDIYKSSTTNEDSSPDDSTAKPSTSSGNNSTNSNKSTESESRRHSQGSLSSTDGQKYAVHESPNNPILHEIQVRPHPKRQNTAFVVPPLDEIQSGILERRQTLGAICMSGTSVESRVEVEDGKLMLTVTEKSVMAKYGDEAHDFEHGGEVQAAEVINPNEISLEDEDEN